MAGKTRSGEGARAEREVSLQEAAELTGLSGKQLRRHMRDGRLRPASSSGGRLTLTLGALREAGLLAASPATHVPERQVEAGGAEPEKVEREKAERERAEREKTERERAEREKTEREKAEREKAEREKAERERAEREKAERERAEREKAERERAEREKAEREKAERGKAEREKAEREKAERGKADREKADREKAEREKADREKAEREKADREKAERAKADRDKADRDKAARARREDEERADNVVPLNRGRGIALEPADLDDLEADDIASLDAEEPDIEEIEGELDDVSPASDTDAEPTVRIEADDAGRAAQGRVVGGMRAEPVTAERGMVVSGSGPWVTATQMHDLMRLMVAEREARSSEWLERTESLYREIIESQKARIQVLEAELKGAQGKLEDALCLVPKGENIMALEQSIRDLRIEVDRKEAARLDAEHDRDRLRDLVDRLRNDLSRAEKRSLEMAEQLRRFRAQGPFERLLGRDPDDR